MNQRGQAEAVFRLMIDSIIGLAILLVIISAITYFQGQAVEQSKYDLEQLVQYAANSPDGQLVSSKHDLSFVKGFGVNSLDIQEWTGVNGKCFSFESSFSSVKITSESKSVEFTQDLTTSVTAKCVPTGSYCNPKDPSGDCCFTCTIYFGKNSSS